MSIDIIVCTS